MFDIPVARLGRNSTAKGRDGAVGFGRTALDVLEFGVATLWIDSSVPGLCTEHGAILAENHSGIDKSKISVDSLFKALERLCDVHGGDYDSRCEVLTEPKCGEKGEWV